MKHISIIFFAFLCFIKGFAYDAFVNDFYFDLNNEEKTATIVAGDKRYIGDISLPSSILFEGEIYTVSSIGESAFYNCIAVTSLSIPSSVVKIEKNAFLKCEGVETLIIEDGPETLVLEDMKTGSGSSTNNYRSGFFSPAFNAKTIHVGRNIQSYNISGIFNYSKVSNLTFGPDVTEIPSNAFNWCNALKEVTIPGTIKKIGNKAFYTSNGIVSVTIEEGVETIGSYAFYRCFPLSSLSLPQSLTSIGASAFEDCNQLKNVTLGKNIEDVGYNTFKGCQKLQTLTVEAIIPPTLSYEIADDIVYRDCKLLVPIGSEDAYKAAVAWKLFNIIEGTASASIEDLFLFGEAQFINGTLKLTSPQHVTITNLQGHIIYDMFTSEVIVPSGLYIVRVGDYSVKVAVK